MHTALVGFIFPHLQLSLVQLRILPVHFAHLLDLIKIHDEALLISVVLLYAFSAKYRQMVGAIEMLHSLVMLIAQKTVDTLIIFKIDITEYTITLYDFI